MDFYDALDQVVALLQQRGRMTYRTLKREFQLDDEGIEDLKEELLFSHPEITEVDGRGLVWHASTLPSPLSRPDPQPPASYTPQHLAERILAEQAAMESRGSADGERKTITALFADLKGSTALIEGLDPEDARAIIDPALQIMMDAVHRYDGYVAQALGDGIFALFGAPIAHEDHPQRALYAALRMQEEMRAYADQSRLKGGIPLQMRVGINTGEVVVRSIRKDDLHTDYVPVGHSTNLAARMEQIATPGSIVISEYTRKLTEGYFELKALGAAAIKGVEEPLNVYEVLGAGPLRTRLQVAARRGLSHFVGRHNELDQIQRALGQAKAGHGQIVGVMGEPGLGKSRLFYEFVGAVREPPLRSQRGCLVLEAFLVSHGKASPYLPIIELLKAYFQIEPTDDERQRQSKVMGQVLTLDRSLEETLPYLFSLLGIEDRQASLQQMDAQIRRRRTFEALKKLFLRESLNQPLILIFEDLHWIDTETQGFLDTLSESVASAKLLLLVNYRPEYRPAWGQKTYYTQLRLAALGKEEAEELLTFLLGNDASLTALKPLILKRTEGTPFFMEEVVQTLAEEGTLVGERGSYRLETTPTELHISPTVQGVLAARIDRLTPEEKDLLQQLAVIGRQFPMSLVKQAVAQPEDEMYRLLSSLQAKEFLYEQPAYPEVEYLFKHALTQEVAYGTVLQEQRRTLHERTAQVLEELYSSSLEEHYGELAHHYSHSGNTAKAIQYLHLAGQQAVQQAANEEAVRYLTAALELLPALPETQESTHQELALQLALGPALMVTKGYANPEVEQTYVRARELCQQVEATSQLFLVAWGLWAFYVSRPVLRLARELAAQLFSLARTTQDPTLLLPAYYAQGVTVFNCGEFTQARLHLEQAWALYDSHQHRTLVLLHGQDIGVTSLSYLSWVLWYLGYPDQARQRTHEAIALAEELSHPFSLAFALGDAVDLYRLRGESQETQVCAEAEIALCREHGFAIHGAIGTVYRNWVGADQRYEGEGLELVQQGLAEVRATGLTWGYGAVLVAEAARKAGQEEEGLAAVAAALDSVGKSGERYYEAELYRLKGELMQQSADLNPESRVTEAEACFHKAITIARSQEAKCWELRATMSLARLWQEQGKKKEAYQLLSEIYNWFTEGFDTADLQEAKALLEE